MASASNTAASMPFSSMTTARCQEAEQVLNHAQLTFVRCLQLGLSIPTFVALFALVWIYARENVKFHANLTLLMANIVIFYLLHSVSIFFVCLRYEFIQLSSTDPCDFLTPIWMVLLTRIPSYGYFMAVPMFHCAIMMERARATLFANRYEREGCTCGWIGVGIVWFITIGYLLFVCWTALADREAFGQPLIITSLTTPANSQIILGTYFWSLAIILLTIIGDYLITVRNRRMQRSPHVINYNLSENFQVRENIVTMRLIFPMDVIYGLMYSLYLIGATIIRSMYQKISPIDYTYYYDLLNSFLFLYITFSLLIYIYFIKTYVKSKRLKMSEPSEQGKIYFRQLNQQWSR